MMQYGDKKYAGYYNVGPEGTDCVTTGDIVDMWCESFGGGMKWVNLARENAPHEANFLKLDCSKLKAAMGWAPRWNINKAIEETAAWTKVYFGRGDVSAEMEKEIREYMEEF